MIIYIVLGIAADDIFVFYDAFQQSAEMDKKAMDTMEKRLTYAFRRAARAMAITSSTTAVAFFANGLSSIQQIQTFGIFAGVIIPVNYLLVIMIFPPAIMWYERNIIAKVTDENGEVVLDAAGNEQWKKPLCICWGRCKKKAEIGPDGKKIAKLNFVERIFDNQINRIVGHPIIKWVIIAVSVGWYVASVWMTTQI